MYKIASENNKILTLPGGKPIEIPSNLLLLRKSWYKASDVIFDQDNYISIWPDSSGNGNDVSQSNQTNKPLYIDSFADFNNNPAVYFDGGDYLLGPGVMNNIDDRDFVMIAAIKPFASNNRAFLAKSLYGGQPNRYGYYDSSFIFQDSTLVYLTVVISNPVQNIEIHEFRRYYSAGASVWFNGNSLASSTTIGMNQVINSSYSFLIGGYNNGSGSVPPAKFFKGWIAEIMILEGAGSGGTIPDNMVDYVRNYFKTKYNLSFF